MLMCQQEFSEFILKTIRKSEISIGNSKFRSEIEGKFFLKNFFRLFRDFFPKISEFFKERRRNLC